MQKLRKSYAFAHKKGMHNFCIKDFFFLTAFNHNFAANIT